MQNPKEAIKQIQALTYGAYQASGQVAALIGASRPENMAEALEQTAARMEQGTVQLRALCESCLPPVPAVGQKPALSPLDRHERRHGKLPLLEQALLVIDEYCDVDSRQVYDADNKGWKAVSNAIKGRLVADDDQFSLSLCLLSQRSPEAQCHIYVLPMADAGDFFFMRSDHFPFSR